MFSSSLKLGVRSLEKFYSSNVLLSCFCRFDTVYLDDDLRVVKDIRGDYLVVDRASYEWKE